MLFSPDCYDSLTLNYQGHFMDYDPLNTWCLMPRLFNSFLIGLYTYFRAFNLDVQTNHTLCLYYHCSKNKQYICTLFCQSQVSLKYIHWRICRYTSTLIRRFFLLSHPLLRLFMGCVDHLASGLETLNILLFYSQELRYTTSTSALSCCTESTKW